MAELRQFEQRAEDLTGALAQGRTRAALRVLRVIPDAATSADGLPLRIEPTQAQHVVSREAGFADWAGLRRASDVASLGRRDAEAAMVGAALAGDDARVDRILERWPDLASRVGPCAWVLARPDAVRDLWARTVNARAGPNDWPPLLYLCHSRYRTADAAVSEARVRLAEELIRLGADPNAGARETETIRGYRSALGAAIGRARNPALANTLLKAGADIADGPTLYEGCAMWEAVRLRDIESQLSLAAEPPQWHVCHALPHALQDDEVRDVDRWVAGCFAEASAAARRS